jgi:hypothetical protein
MIASRPGKATIGAVELTWINYWIPRRRHHYAIDPSRLVDRSRAFKGTTFMTRRHSIPTPDTPPGSVTRYRDRIFDDLRHDPYQAKGKYREPTVCAGCGAIFENGRWKSGEAPPHAHKATCPACARTRDQLPAGFVTLSGEFFNAHRAELLQLAHNTAENERSQHPLHRIMNVAETPDEVVITTCDVHSARRIGEALERAYDGDLEMRFGEDEYLVRVNWKR